MRKLVILLSVTILSCGPSEAEIQNRNAQAVNEATTTTIAPTTTTIAPPTTTTIAPTTTTIAPTTTTIAPTTTTIAPTTTTTIAQDVSTGYSLKFGDQINQFPEIPYCKMQYEEVEKQLKEYFLKNNIRLTIRKYLVETNNNDCYGLASGSNYSYLDEIKDGGFVEITVEWNSSKREFPTTIANSPNAVGNGERWDLYCDNSGKSYLRDDWRGLKNGEASDQYFYWGLFTDLTSPDISCLPDAMLISIGYFLADGYACKNVNCDNNLTTTTTTTVISVDYPQLVISEISSSIPEYNRDDWNHWIDENGDCQNTRHEVLIEESFETVTYTNDTYCLVSTGKWYGNYTGQYYYNASELDIDHFIPLKNAHQSGGYNWSSAKKEEFANYRLDPDNLIAVNLSANRSKGAKGPDEWKPSNTQYWCEYAYDWIRIKDYWNLTATQAEWDALVSMIETCPADFAYADAEEEPVVELPIPTTTTTTTTTTIASSQPDNPGDTKNCGDFSNYSEAKTWFDTYYEYYGDVAKLDSDDDLEPCESLPGGP